MLQKSEFFWKHRLAPNRQLVTVLPGSRKGEAARHLPALVEAVERIYRQQATHFLFPASETTGRARMRQDLAEVAARLAGDGRDMAKAAALVEELMEGHAAHVSSRLDHASVDHGDTWGNRDRVGSGAPLPH